MLKIQQTNHKNEDKSQLRKAAGSAALYAHATKPLGDYSSKGNERDGFLFLLCAGSKWLPNIVPGSISFEITQI